MMYALLTKELMCETSLKLTRDVIKKKHPDIKIFDTVEELEKHLEENNLIKNNHV